MGLRERSNVRARLTSQGRDRSAIQGPRQYTVLILDSSTQTTVAGGPPLSPAGLRLLPYLQTSHVPADRGAAVRVPQHRQIRRPRVPPDHSIRTGGSPRPTTRPRRSPVASAAPARSAGPASPTPSRRMSRRASGAASMSRNGPGCGSPWPRAHRSPRSSTRTPGRRRPDVSRGAGLDHYRDGPRDGGQQRRVHPADDETGLRPRHRHRDAGADRVRLDPGSGLPTVCPQSPGAADAAMRRRLAPRHRTRPAPSQLDQADDDQDDQDGEDSAEGARRVRSTRRRQDAPDLPRVPMDNRTVGRTFTTAGRQGVPAVDVPHPHPALLRADPARHRGPGRPGDAMTTGGPRWMRCTSRSWSTGSGRTCAGAPATGCSTSPPSNPRPGSPRTCTPRSAAPSPGRCSSR